MGFLPEMVLGLLALDRPVAAAACPKRHVSWDRIMRLGEAERLATPDLMDLALSYNVDTKRFDGTLWTAERRGGFLKERSGG